MKQYRDDLEKLEKAIDLLEDGPIDYLGDEDAFTLTDISDKIDSIIRDILSAKELAHYSAAMKNQVI